MPNNPWDNWTEILTGEAKSCEHQEIPYEDLVAFFVKERSCVSVQTMIDKLLMTYRVIKR